MRAPVIVALWLGAVFGFLGTASADIQYHFAPGIEGQTVGYAQFVEVAPEVGPDNFKVQLSGSLDGFAPSSDPSSARAYLDKWGLGVLNPTMGKDAGVLGQVLIDGRHGGEYMRLEFPEAIRLTYLIFASVGLGDDFDLLADGNLIDLGALFPGAATIKEIAGSQGNWPGKVDFTKAQQSLPYAVQWDILVRSSVIGDGIQLENAAGERVPEPGTLILWSVALAAAGCYGARRKSAAINSRC